MSEVVPLPPVPYVNYFLHVCPAAVNRAKCLCSITEDTRRKVAAGVANSGAGAEAGAGAGAGVGAAGVLLECCVTFPTKRCPNSSMFEIVIA